MNQQKTIDGILLAKMFKSGAKNLKEHVSTINDLNVFPIPDGDTGDNMLMTSIGGVDKIGDDSTSLSNVSHKISDGMLLSARGNSGVILSQIFEGIAGELENVETAETNVLAKALQKGTKHAYSAVMDPTEGTMLTVMRCATEYISRKVYDSPEELLKDFLEEAKRTLEKTPDMLPVLKKAGVVDSGGAGLVYIVEGMLKAFTNDDTVIEDNDFDFAVNQPGQDIDVNLFTEDSVLEYGYCTEVLVRLMNAKTNIETFDVSTITDYLKGLGNSVVTFKNGSIVKIHVHTKTPDKVLSFCQQYGEFLKIKIENMSLQHNNTLVEKDKVQNESFQEKDDVEKQRYGVVAVASGEGIKNLFMERGANVIVDGGQSMNPSTQDFLDAFDKVHAKTIFVLPNNSNIILAAKMAASMYTASKVYVIESNNMGAGYAALSMYNPNCNNEEEIVSELTDAMSGVTSLAVSKSVRNAEGVTSGDYIGFVGKDILCDNPVRKEAVLEAFSKIDLSSFEICLLIFGKEANESEAEEIKKEINAKYPAKEVFVVDGKQDIYDYILILE